MTSPDQSERFLNLDNVKRSVRLVKSTIYWLSSGRRHKKI
jgi:hypothetical protein